MSRAEETVEIDDVQCIRQTDKALCLLIDGEQVWVPKSQVMEGSEIYEDGQYGVLIVSAWFARGKGWT